MSISQVNFNVIQDFDGDYKGSLAVSAGTFIGVTRLEGLRLLSFNKMTRPYLLNCSTTYQKPRINSPKGLVCPYCIIYCMDNINKSLISH